MEKVLLREWDEISSSLLAFIRKRISNKEDAEDILQNVYIKLHENIHTLRDEEKITSWIYQITRNTINECYRKCYRIKTTDFSDEVKDEVALDCCEESNLNNEVSETIKRFILLLPEHYQEILRLYEFEGLSHKEIADRFNITVNTSKSKVRRGKERLRKLLDQCCIFEVDKYGNILDYSKK